MSHTDHSSDGAAKVRKLMESLEKAGWSGLNLHPIPADLSLGHMMYLCDVHSGDLFMVALAKDSTADIVEKCRQLGLTHADSTQELAVTMNVMSSKNELPAEEEQMIGTWAALYLSGTNAYEQFWQFPNCLHFITIRYKSEKSGKSWFRTGTVRSPTPLSPANVEHSANELLHQSYKAYPEKFDDRKLAQYRIRSKP